MAHPLPTISPPVVTDPDRSDDPGFCPLEEHCPPDFVNPVKALRRMAREVAGTDAARRWRHLADECARRGIVRYGLEFERLALDIERRGS